MKDQKRQTRKTPAKPSRKGSNAPPARKRPPPPKNPPSKAGKKPKKMGRPRVELDWDMVMKLCEIQCTGEEIAGVLDISYDTLTRRIKEEHGQTFAEFYAQRSSPGRVSLRRLQFRAAQSGNVRMLEWLGKQYLGQSDKREFTGEGGGPIELNVADFEAEALRKGG